MKKILLYLLIVTMSLGTLTAQILTDFDGNQNINFSGWPNVPTVMANPYPAGINTSANCAEFVRGTEQWAHAYSELTTPLDFSTNNTFELKVWSPIACTVLFKLETLSGTGGTTETPMDITTPNEWTQLSFAFPGAASNLYDKIVIFFDFATTTDNTFYFDDLEMVSGNSSGLTQISLPVTFEDTTVDYTVTDFGGNVTVLGVDPVNSANNVAISTKASGAETWAGTTIGTPAGFSSVIALSATDTKMSAKVYSPAAGVPIRLKVENHLDNTQTCETEVLSTVANAWETLEFDFSNEAPGTAALNLSWTFDMASIFFDFGSMGADGVFYWDDVEFSGGSTNLDELDLPITFDNSTVDYTFESWGGNDTQLGVDPEDSGNNVAVTTKPATAETWAGSAIVGTSGGLATAIPFTSTDTKMNVRVYSPAAGVPVLLKVEDKADGSHSCENLQHTTIANGWETLVFDFANHETGTPALDLSWTYNKVGIFFDFGNTGTDNMFYWDDVKFGDVDGVNDIIENNVSLYPNPVQNVLNIEGLENADRLSIYNVVGMQVANIEISNDIMSIDMSEFTNGIYIISLHNDNGTVSTYRVIKQ